MLMPVCGSGLTSLMLVSGLYLSLSTSCKVDLVIPDGSSERGVGQGDGPFFGSSAEGLRGAEGFSIDFIRLLL